jgi:hypothetical protein
MVRWIQAQGKDGAPAGLGLEILSLPASQTRQYIQAFDHVDVFIPSLRQLRLVKKAAELF